MYQETIKELINQIPTMTNPTHSFLNMTFTNELESVRFEIIFEFHHERLDDIYVHDKETEEEWFWMANRSKSFPEYVAKALIEKAGMEEHAKDVFIEMDQPEGYWTEENKDSVRKHGS